MDKRTQVVNSVTFERKLRDMAAACGREWIAGCVGEEVCKARIMEREVTSSAFTGCK